MVKAYFAPRCPLSVLDEKSMWIRVTSGGSIAAPGPFLIESSWKWVNGRLFERGDVRVYLL